MKKSSSAESETKEQKDSHLLTSCCDKRVEYFANDDETTNRQSEKTPSWNYEAVRDLNVRTTEECLSTSLSTDTLQSSTSKCIEEREIIADDFLTSSITIALERLLRVCALAVAFGIGVKVFLCGLRLYIYSGFLLMLRLLLCHMLDSCIALVDIETLHRLKSTIESLCARKYESLTKKWTVESPHIIPSMDDCVRRLPEWGQLALASDGPLFPSSTYCFHRPVASHCSRRSGRQESPRVDHFMTKGKNDGSGCFGHPSRQGRGIDDLCVSQQGLHDQTTKTISKHYRAFCPTRPSFSVDHKKTLTPHKKKSPSCSSISHRQSHRSSHCTTANDVSPRRRRPCKTDRRLHSSETKLSQNPIMETHQKDQLRNKSAQCTAETNPIEWKGRAHRLFHGWLEREFSPGPFKCYCKASALMKRKMNALSKNLTTTTTMIVPAPSSHQNYEEPPENAIFNSFDFPSRKTTDEIFGWDSEKVLERNLKTKTQCSDFSTHSESTVVSDNFVNQKISSDDEFWSQSSSSSFYEDFDKCGTLTLA